jgi:hypothetical protein
MARSQLSGIGATAIENLLSAPVTVAPAQAPTESFQSQLQWMHDFRNLEDLLQNHLSDQGMIAWPKRQIANHIKNLPNYRFVSSSTCVSMALTIFNSWLFCPNIHLLAHACPVTVVYECRLANRHQKWGE